MATFDRRRGLRRFYLRFPTSAAADPEKKRRQGRATRLGIVLTSSLTVWLLAWLSYRWIVRPSWVAILPDLLAELLALVETAGAFTLAVLWIGLGYRHWRHRGARPAPPPLRPEEAVERLHQLSPRAFERYVAALFRQKGYRVVVRGGSGDHGVDLELTSNSGRRAIVQCKRYRNTVGEEVVRDLFGTLLHERVVHAFLVTTADISDAAREWAQGKPMTLIDGELLVRIAGKLSAKSAHK